jgi:hypothetical protein
MVRFLGLEREKMQDLGYRDARPAHFSEHGGVRLSGAVLLDRA